MLNKTRVTTRKLTFCAILAALGVVFLALGSFIDVFELCAVMLASAVVVLAVLEAGGVWPWLTYASVTLVSMLLLPYKFPALVFLFAGYYPIVKSLFEKTKRLFAWIFKILFFNVSLTVLFVACAFVFTDVDLTLWEGVGMTVTYVIYYILGNVIFALYDVVLTRLISLYVYKLRARFHIGGKK